MSKFTFNQKVKHGGYAFLALTYDLVAASDSAQDPCVAFAHFGWGSPADDTADAVDTVEVFIPADILDGTMRPVLDIASSAHANTATEIGA